MPNHVNSRNTGVEGFRKKLSSISALTRRILMCDESGWTEGTGEGEDE